MRIQEPNFPLPVARSPDATASTKRKAVYGIIKLLGLACMIAAATSCTGSVSATRSFGGGDDDDASSCITIELVEDSGGSVVANRCSRDVNLLEFSTGSRGLILVPANTTITRQETIAAWGACIAPAIPERTGDFEFFCD